MRDTAQPVAQVARDLGITDHLPYRWRTEQHQAESQSHTRQSMRAEQEELAQLRRENPVLRQPAISEVLAHPEDPLDHQERMPTLASTFDGLRFLARSTSLSGRLAFA